MSSHSLPTSPDLHSWPTKLQLYWALDQLESPQKRWSTVSEVVRFLVEDVGISVSMDTAGKALSRSRGSVHREQGKKGYRLMEPGRRELNAKKSVRNITAIAAVAGRDALIIAALKKLDPGYSCVYQQIVYDLADMTRVSYRGTAHEMRELLRNVLNHVAPDDIVGAQAGFVFEHEQKKPTRAQKMTYILRCRKLSSAQIDPAVKSIAYIDTQFDTLTLIPSAVYGAGADSAHSEPRDMRTDVMRLKEYLDPILRDILGI